MMNSFVHIPPPLAEIPLLDWIGPEFLKFYGFSLIIAIGWSWVRSRMAMRKFEIPRAAEIPTDPYEISYLSAGGSRVFQLAVVRLIKKGLIHWRSGLLGLKSDDVPADLPVVEEALLERVYHAGSSGLRIQDAGSAISTCLRAIEVKLAAAGLRPTAAERNKACVRAVWPLIFLGLLGVIKLVIGLARDKPVGFLVVLLLVTLIAACIIGSRVRRITPAGEQLLAKLRGDHQSAKLRVSSTEAEDLPILSNGVALFGTASLVSFAAFSDIHQDFNKHFGSLKNSATGGCSTGCGGGSSGCSSGGGDGGGGGCGGGGCGGCGGGD